MGRWLQWSDEQEREEDRRTLIADVLTLESRMSEWLAREDNELKRLASVLPRNVTDAFLLRERPAWWQVVGLIAAIVGVSLLAWSM